MSVKEGDKAPDFTLETQDGEFNLSSCLGKKVVLYFYPKDNTSGCSIEAMDFTREKKNFEKAGAVIAGVSADSVKSHCSFAEKKSLTIPLLSDTSHEVCEKYGVWQLKKRCGKESMGIVRTSFIIDEKGIIAKRYDKVSVKGHVDEVLSFVKNM